jgi:hypothetical protein
MAMFIDINYTLEPYKYTFREIGYSAPVTMANRGHQNYRLMVSYVLDNTLNIRLTRQIRY